MRAEHLKSLEIHDRVTSSHPGFDKYSLVLKPEFNTVIDRIKSISLLLSGKIKFEDAILKPQSFTDQFPKPLTNH